MFLYTVHVLISVNGFFCTRLRVFLTPGVKKTRCPYSRKPMDGRWLVSTSGVSPRENGKTGSKNSTLTTPTTIQFNSHLLPGRIITAGESVILPCGYNYRATSDLLSLFLILRLHTPNTWILKFSTFQRESELDIASSWRDITQYGFFYTCGQLSMLCHQTFCCWIRARLQCYPPASSTPLIPGPLEHLVVNYPIRKVHLAGVHASVFPRT